MSSSSNHLYLMSFDEELYSSISDSYSLLANQSRTIFSFNFINQHGIHKLYEEIENEIIRNEISILTIDVSSIVYDPFLILELKEKYGLLIVLLAIDDEFKFDWISSSYSTIADLVITSDYVSVDRYRQSGVNAVFLPLPVSMRLSHDDSDQKYDISFVGRLAQDKGSRNNFREYLDLPEHNLNVSWFTSSEPEEYLTTEEMYDVFRNSNINLNFTGITSYRNAPNVLFDRIRTIKLRPFEIMSAGGFCLTEYSIGLSKCFRDGEEVVYFRNKKELIQKIRYYLKHPDEAKRIAIAGSKLVERSFSKEAISTKFSELISDSQANKGLDLYGDPQEILVSTLFAHHFIEFSFFRASPFIFKGKFRLFLNDFSRLLSFVGKLFTTIGSKQTGKVIFISIFRISRTIIAKTKFW